MPLLEITNVGVSYGSLKALNDVSCSINGGAVGLLGPNGAGKSTLLKALLGFVRADHGTIKMFGLDMPSRAIEVRQRLGYMPEKEIVARKISAVSFLSYCGALFGVSRVDAIERAHEVLNYVGMDDERYRKMETYSTGMCQRVKFAQALVHDPKLLLLDEPTNGLDPDGRIEMLDLIKQLAAERKIATILSSHLLPDVEHVCDRVIVINKGEIVRDGTMHELTSMRDGLFELRVRDSKQAFRHALDMEGCRCREQYNGNMVVTKPDDWNVSRFFEIARATGTQIRHMKPLQQKLEDVFMEAIRSNSTVQKEE